MSALRAISTASDSGYSTEIIAVLDKPNALTREVVSGMLTNVGRIVELEFGDVGRARNEGIREASGDFIALLDADDLWGPNWLLEALRCAEQRSDPIVWHPEVNIYIGSSNHILHHKDMENSAFEPTSLMLENRWTALSFARRELYLSNPYPVSDIVQGIGFEDWAWNMNVITNGALHKVVPGTGHIIRRKRVASLSGATVRANGVPPFTEYINYIMESRNKRLSTPSRPTELDAARV